MAGFVLVGSLGLSACGTGSGTGSGSESASSQEAAIGGYEGWWNSTPASGDTNGLPTETVAVNTDTGEVVDAFNREINERGEATKLSDVKYKVTPDPNWPTKSVVIIDTSTDEVIETFRIHSNGEPMQ